MRYALVLLLAFFAVGCSNIESPTAIVQNASLGGVSADGMTLNLNLLVSNPNAVSLPLSNTSYSLSLADTKILDGDADPKTTIPAKGSAPVSLPIRIAWDDVLKAKDALVKSGGNVPYSFDGKVKLGAGLSLLGDRGTVPLKYNGTLPLRDALTDPEIIMNSKAAQAIARAVITRLPF